MTFAEKMRELRDAKGLSEAKLAELSGVPFGTVHEYGLGRRKPSFAAVLKLAKALGVDCTAFAMCSDLADGEQTADKPKPEKPTPKGDMAMSLRARGAPELVKAVDDGRVTLADATKLLELSREDQVKAVGAYKPAAKKPAPKKGGKK